MGIFRRKAKGDPERDDPTQVEDGAEQSVPASDTEDEVADLAPGELDEAPDDETPHGEAEVDNAELGNADLNEAELGNAELDDTQDEADEPGRLPRPHPVDRSKGPFDRSEVESLDDRLDFGALAVVAAPGMELRLDIDEASQQLTGITAIQGESACQLQAFAAPKSSGIWDGIRDDIADGLIASGGTATEQLGPLGIELQARMPGQGADGRTTYSPARFIGVDGPRWFLRAVLSGSAAVDEDAATTLLDYVRQAVVVRGGEARAPRELLPLSMPEDLLAAAAAQEAGDAADAPSASDLKPFERGPEITEVR